MRFRNLGGKKDSKVKLYPKYNKSSSALKSCLVHISKAFYNKGQGKVKLFYYYLSKLFCSYGPSTGYLAWGIYISRISQEEATLHLDFRLGKHSPRPHTKCSSKSNSDKFHCWPDNLIRMVEWLKRPRSLKETFLIKQEMFCSLWLLNCCLFTGHNAVANLSPHTSILSLQPVINSLSTSQKKQTIQSWYRQN